MAREPHPLHFDKEYPCGWNQQYTKDPFTTMPRWPSHQWSIAFALVNLTHPSFQVKIGQSVSGNSLRAATMLANNYAVTVLIHLSQS